MEIRKGKALVFTYYLVPEIYINNLRSYMDLNLKCLYPFGGKDTRGRAHPPSFISRAFIG